MQFYEYQKLAERTEKARPVSDISARLLSYRLQHAILGLSSEIGELADAVKKYVIYEKEIDSENIIEEVGDILWYLSIVCNTMNFSMEEAAQANIEKLKKRYPDRYTNQDALERKDKNGPPTIPNDSK